MKELIELNLRDEFRFTEQSRRELRLEQDDIFIVLVKYGGPESSRGILVGNSRTKKRMEVPAGLEIESDQPCKTVATVRKRSKLSKRRNAWYSQKTKIVDIFLAGIVLLIIYSVFFVHIFK